jgi:hypothetical protein
VVRQQAARRVRDGGAIINFSSSVTRLQIPGYGAYAAPRRLRCSSTAKGQATIDRIGGAGRSRQLLALATRIGRLNPRTHPATKGAV